MTLRLIDSPHAKHAMLAAFVPALSYEQDRILRWIHEAGGHEIFDNTRSRPINELVRHGLATAATRHVPTQSVHGRHEVTASITLNGRIYVENTLAIEDPKGRKVRERLRQEKLND